MGPVSADAKRTETVYLVKSLATVQRKPMRVSIDPTVRCKNQGNSFGNLDERNKTMPTFTLCP